jgi:transcriptional antiterminator RfaH
MKHWYLLYTKPRQEQIAVSNLHNQAYRALAPQITLTKRTSQGWKAVSEPLFPNYVFIQLDDVTDNWAPIRNTRGVNGFVRFGSGLPAPISDQLMQPLLELDLAQLGTQLSLCPKVGDCVDVAIGEAWINALVTAESGKGRIEVLLTILGQEQSLWVESHQVRLPA